MPKGEPHKIMVRFCGGCNPYYKQLELFEEINRESTINFDLIDPTEKNPNNHVDLILLLNGCRSSCLKKDRSFDDKKQINVIQLVPLEGGFSKEQLKKEILKLLSSLPSP